MSVTSGRLTRDTLVYGVGGSAAQIVNVVFIPVFTRIFSTGQFGALDFLITLNSVGVLIAQAGLNSAVFYFYRQTDDPAERRRLTASAIGLAAALGTALAIIGAVFAAPISRLLLGSEAYATPVALSFAWIPVNLVATLSLDLLRLEFRPVAYSVLGFGRTLAASVIGAILAGPYGWGISGMLASYLVVGLLGIVATLVLTRSVWLPRFDGGAAYRLLRFGLPLIPTGLAYWIIAYSDRFLVIWFLGISAAGIYALANRVAMGVQLVLYAFEAAWWPYAYARAREPDHRELFARIFGAFSVGMIVLFALLGMFAREILLVLSTPDFLPAYPYVGLLALGLVIHGAYGIISVGVQLAQRTRHMAWTSGLAAVLNVALNLALIPILGILGAAIATLVAYTISTGLLFVIAQRAYHIPYELGRPAAVLVGASVALALGLALDATAAGIWFPWITLAKLALAGIGLFVLSITLPLSPASALAGLRRAVRGT